MENGEKMFIKAKDVDRNTIGVDDSGYSEKKADKDIELQAGQWFDLNQPKKSRGTGSDSTRQSPQKRSQPKIGQSQNPPDGTYKASLLNAITDISRELEDEIKGYLVLVEDGGDESEKVLQQISSQQATLRALLKALKWEQKGSLDISKLPKDVQNLLK